MRAPLPVSSLILLLTACAPAGAPPSAPVAPAPGPLVEPSPLAVEAAGPAVPTPGDDRPIVLRAARLFDGRSDAMLAGGAEVVVERGLVTRAGKPGPAPRPDAEVIDLGDATLMPGFIDAHTHVTEEGSGDYYKDRFEDLVRFPAEQAFYAEAYAHKLLAAGFTTIRDLGSSDGLDVGLRNAIEKGLVEGPRMLVAVHMLSATGGHGDGLPAPPGRLAASTERFFDGVCNGADACMEAVRTQVKYGADVIKIAASGGVLSLADAVDVPQLTPAEMSAIVGEAHRLGKKVAAHCHGDTAAKAAIEAGVDSIEHGTFLKPDTLAMMKRKGTVLIPTLLALDWLSQPEHSAKFPPAIRAKIDAAAKAHAQVFKDAMKAGVTIGFGTDSGVSAHGVNAREFVLMTELGMAPAAALRTAMTVDAKLLGIDRQAGSLEPGKLADVVAVPGDPLKDIHATERVELVMRKGRVYKRPAAR